MKKLNWGEICTLADLGEAQAVEFKGNIPMDGHHKNLVCCEIAAMANGGGGRLIVGVSDGPPPAMIGVAPDVVAQMTQSGWLQKVVRERMEPPPGLFVYAVAPNDGRGNPVVVIEIEPPFMESPPVFQPVILTKDVQDQQGKLRYAAGTVLSRDHDQCLKVIHARHWERVMHPILNRYRELEMLPLLRMLVQRNLVDEHMVRDPATTFDSTLPSYSALIAAVQSASQRAARHEYKIVLDGVGPFSYARQHEIMRSASVCHRGWPLPPYQSDWVQESADGNLSFQFSGRPGTQRWAPPQELIQEFWLFSPEGVLGGAFLDRIDLYSHLDGKDLPPPGLERPLDAVEIVQGVIELAEFARNLAQSTGAPRFWCSFTLGNVLNRPVSPSLHPKRAIVDRLFSHSIRTYRSNQGSITVAESFQTEAFATTWRDVAVTWTQRVLDGFGLTVPAERVRAIHDETLEMNYR